MFVSIENMAGVLPSKTPQMTTIQSCKHEGSLFPGQVFPTSYTLLYCSITDCPSEAPFLHAISLVEHLLASHNIVIHKSEAVLPFLDRYLKKKQPLKTNNTLGGEGDEADWALREVLQQERLKQMLQIQAFERAHSHRQARICLFCPFRSTDRYDLFKHMFQDHSFNIGQLDNLVMVDDFLGQLESTMHSNRCIYCGKEFPSSGLLKKHMRSKSHYKIQSGDRKYDKYYLVNYVQAGKTWEMLPKDDEAERNEAVVKEDETWSDLSDSIDRQTMCLFCQMVSSSSEECLSHMKARHEFDFRQIQQEQQLDFYHSVQLINYLRHQRSELMCPGCFVSFESDDAIVEHLHSSNCIKSVVSNRGRWSLVEYYIPIYEDDPLLEIIDDISFSDQELEQPNGSE